MKAQARTLTEYTSIKNKDVSLEMQRSVPDTEILLRLTKEFNPYLIVELGHGNGGFTLAMHETCPKAYIKSFDIRRLPLDEVMDNVSGRVSFINNNTLEGCPVVRRFLDWGSKKFLYCDNGHKTQEVLMYAHMLKKGDMLGVHDYTPKPVIHVGVVTALVEPYLEKIGFEKHHHEEFEAQRLRSRLWIKKS